MKIRRSVFEKLMPETIADKKGIYQFFRTGVLFPEDPEWWGEDSYFCKTWNNLGGTIYIEPDINFKHWGMTAYPGNYHEYLLSKAIDD